MATITLKGNTIHTNGSLPGISAKAPDFQLVNTDLQDISLETYQGKKKLISIVPSLDTSICALSAKKLNEMAQKNPDVVVLFVSADLPFAQKRVCGADSLHHITTLSMMRSKKFAEDYGVLIQDGPLAGLAARAVVVLDKENKVIYTQLVPEIAQEPDYEQATKALLG